jgi:beta-glucosidase
MSEPKYLDPSLSCKERARDLVSRMTVEEKASQLRFNSPPIPRLGVPAYNWWNEALHGVARAGTATVFPQAIALAAMFDGDEMERVGDVVAEEGRAKYNMYSAHGDRDIYKGLTFWSPNVNIFRDPRWGRGHETYGEDPFLSGELGKRFVGALQKKDKHGYMKSAACAKHFAVHSGPESLRHEFDAQVSQKDLWETYLPAFEALVTQARVEGVMGAYNRTNGEPCCGSKALLKDILRDKWRFDGYVTSDCWAIRDFHEHHMVTNSMQESVALALKNGCDINCGNAYLHMLSAFHEGLVTEEEIERACVHAMTTRMRLGLFDDRCEFSAIGYGKNCAPEHIEAALDAARKSMVLLKNDGVLPLDAKKLKTVAVVGPNADNRVALMGNYHGTADRYITPLEGLQDALEPEDVRVLYSVGCELRADRSEGLAFEHDRIAEAVAAAEMSDVVIACLGLDETIEGEAADLEGDIACGDKLDLDLPRQQQLLLEKLLETGKPVVLVLMTGSAMAINLADERCAAILEAWYPGARGGKAVAEVLLGKISPSGKLPVTFYRSMEDLPAFTDYSMKNRTYRYFGGEPLYPFGYGLSYADFALTDARLEGALEPGKPLTVTVTVKNHSGFAAEEVVEVYIKNLTNPLAVKNHSLCSFRRVRLEPGEEKTIELTIRPEARMVVCEDGELKAFDDKFRLYVGFSQPDARSVALTGKAPLSIDL